MNLGRCGKKWSRFVLRYYPRIYYEELIRIKALVWIADLGPKSNPESTEYGAGTVITTDR
jgi:hypothetical protein